MTLAALATWDPSDGEARLRSAMEHRMRAAGAIVEQRGPWMVSASLPHEDTLVEHLGFADASHLGKLELRGGARPPQDRDRHVLQISPGRWIVLCPWSARSRIAAELRTGRDLVLDMSGAWSLLLLAGSEAETLLRRLGPIVQLPGGGPVADVPGRAFRRSGLIWVMVAVEYAQHLWDVCGDLSAPLGGGPIGFDALAARSDDALMSLGELESSA